MKFEKGQKLEWHTGPRMAKRLKPVAIPKLIKTPGRYSDGDGLQLHVQAGERASWCFRYRVNKKQKEISLGPVSRSASDDKMTLAEARLKVAEWRISMRQAALDGRVFDPLERKRAGLLAERTEEAKAKTFGDCAEAYWKAHKSGWRNAKHAEQVLNTLKTHAAHVWKLPVAAIETPHVLHCLKPIWETKTETATRVRQRMENVLDWAAVSKYRSGDNPARWRGHLDHLLPKPTKLKKVEHHPALPYGEIAGFMEALRQRVGMGARALEFQIITAARPGEVSGARWSEIDLKAKTWTVPAERMKASKEHRVPLSDDAIKLLCGIEQVDEFVFSTGTEAAITTAAAMKHLKALRPGLHAHGFRSTFRDWAAEQTSYPREVIEAQLAHQLKDKAEAAYFRSDVFDKRARLVQEWARYIRTKPAGGQKVVSIKKKRA